MYWIPQLDGGYDQDDDYAEGEGEESVSSSYSTSSYFSNESTEEEEEEQDGSKEVNLLRKPQRNSQRLLRKKSNLKIIKEGNNKIVTRRQQKQLQQKKTTSKRGQRRSSTSASAIEEGIGGGGKDSGEMEQHQPKRKRGRPPSLNTTNNSKKGVEISGGKGRPLGSSDSKRAEEISSPNPNMVGVHNGGSSQMICPKCKKEVENNEALKKHSWWCNSTRMTRSTRPGASSTLKRLEKPVGKQNGHKNEVGESGGGSSTATPPRSRGRPPKKKLKLEDPVVESVVVAHHDDLRNRLLLEQQQTSSNPQVQEDCNSREGDYDDEIDKKYEGGPAVCPNCKMRYRNLQSLQKHLPTCNDIFSGSSSSDSEEEQDVSFVQQLQPSQEEFVECINSTEQVPQVRLESQPGQVHSIPEIMSQIEVNYNTQQPPQTVLPQLQQEVYHHNISSPILRLPQSQRVDEHVGRLSSVVQPQQSEFIDSNTRSPNFSPQLSFGLPSTTSFPPPGFACSSPSLVPLQPPPRIHQTSLVQQQQHEMTTVTLQDTITGQLYRINIPAPQPQQLQQPSPPQQLQQYPSPLAQQQLQMQQTPQCHPPPHNPHVVVPSSQSHPASSSDTMAQAQVEHQQQRSHNIQIEQQQHAMNYHHLHQLSHPFHHSSAQLQQQPEVGQMSGSSHPQFGQQLMNHVQLQMIQQLQIQQQQQHQQQMTQFHSNPSIPSSAALHSETITGGHLQLGGLNHQHHLELPLPHSSLNGSPFPLTHQHRSLLHPQPQQDSVNNSIMSQQQQCQPPTNISHYIDQNSLTLAPLVAKHTPPPTSTSFMSLPAPRAEMQHNLMQQQGNVVGGQKEIHFPQHMNLNAQQQLQLAAQSAFHQSQLMQQQHAQLFNVQSPHLGHKTNPSGVTTSQNYLSGHLHQQQPHQPSFQTISSNNLNPLGSSSKQFTNQEQILNAKMTQEQHHHQLPLLHTPQQHQFYHHQQQPHQTSILESLHRQVQLQFGGQNILQQSSHLPLQQMQQGQQQEIEPQNQTHPSPPQPTGASFQLQIPTAITGGIVLQQQSQSQIHPTPTTPKHFSGSVQGMDKYRKVLPARPIEPKPVQASISTPTTTANTNVKSHLANRIMEKQFQTQPMVDSISADCQQNPALRKNPILTAVVRPMEHPLQKLSHQISQIESTFNNLSVGIASSSGGVADAPTPSNDTAAAATVSPEGTAGEDLVAVVAPSRTRPIIKRNKTISKSPATPIKLTLERKEHGYSYSVKDISETGEATNKEHKFKSLKIKARVTCGELEGTLMDVIVEPKIHIIPIPNPDSDKLDSNVTIPEGGEGEGSVIPSIPVGFAEHGGIPKLAYRAVVVYEVKSGSTVIYRSSDVRAIWCQIFETAQGTRLNRNLPPISYPATNLSLVHVFNMLGLTHRAIQFLLKHLPKKNKETPFKKLPPKREEMDAAAEDKRGCARTEGYGGRKPFDMFGWLASKHRKPLEKIPTSSEDIWKTTNMPMARNLKERAEKTLVVMWSIIHGRGLYTRKDIEKGDQVIEYAGEVIRSPVCDQREKFYETKGIGCYMFRINDEYVIDATMKGNSARFINHSCQPNCESKTVRISGVERIVILARRKIFSGEELTYDYKFEKEEKKIPCACASTRCRKYLN